MLPWSQRRQRTTWQRHKAQVNRRAAFLIATDENGVDPRQNPHDTVHMGHATHGPGGAAPVVAAKQTGPAPHRSQKIEFTPVAARGSPPPSPRHRLPPGGENLRATGAGDSSRATPSFRPGPRHNPGRRGQSHPVVAAPQNARLVHQICALCDRLAYKEPTQRIERRGHFAMPSSADRSLSHSPARK